MGNWREAEKSFHAAAMEAPDTREPWCELAMMMYRHSRWEECFAYAMRALRITNRELVYTCDPAVWEHQPHDLASISAYRLGLKELALEQALLAVEKTPHDLRLQQNVEYIRASLAEAPPDLEEHDHEHRAPDID
jgi:hypothetical protein